MDTIVKRCEPIAAISDKEKDVAIIQSLIVGDGF